MSFNGSEGGFITLEKGALMTAAYRTKFPNGIQSRFLGKDKLLEILEQPGCMGVRIYFACGDGKDVKDTSNNLNVVTVGADSGENDMLGLILDMSIPCPPTCSAPNPLNT